MLLGFVYRNISKNGLLMKKCIKLAHCDALHIKIHKGQKIVDYLLLIVEELAK